MFAEIGTILEVRSIPEIALVGASGPIVAASEVLGTAAIAEAGVFEFGLTEVFLHEQWAAPGGDDAECAEDLFFGEFRMFVTELLEDGCEEFMLRVAECCDDLFMKANDSLFVDRPVGWQGHGFDGLSSRAFEALEDAASAGVNKENCFAAAASAAGAADAVHVGFAISGEIIVDDVGDAGDVESAGGNIGGYDDVEVAGFELFDDAFALGLSHFSAEGGGAVTVPGEQLSEGFGGAAEADEDDGCVEVFGFEQSQECGFLLVIAGDDVALADGVSGSGFLANFNVGGVFEMLLCDTADRCGHGCGKECRLAGFRELLEDPVDAFGEPHLEHLVGFVQHKAAEAFELQRPTFHVVHYSAGCAHNDVDAAIEQ